VAEPSRRTEFDRRYKAGFWASRIETQDKVAAIVGVEALGGSLELVPHNLTSKGGRLAFEAREDFEIRWNGGRQYVSVKDRQVDRPDLREAIANLDTFRQEVGPDKIQTVRVEAAGLTSSARTFYEDIQRLRELRGSGAEADYATAAEEFFDELGVRAELAEALVVCERRIGQNPGMAAALFAHAMRMAIKVHNYGDTEIIGLFEEISSGTLHDRRVTRGVLDLGDLERILISPLVPLQISAYQVDYVRTRFGYIRDQARRVDLGNEYRIVMTCSKSLMREWRRKTFRDRFKDLIYRGHIGCLACGHPLIANLNGRNGLACPDCGYQPFLTLFYACDCGSGVVVQRQPDLSSFELVRDAIRVLRHEDLKCMNCGKRPSNEKFIGRLFSLPVPYPIDGYPTSVLVEWREKLGWERHRKFARPGEPDLSPQSALERTTAEEPEGF
jgi:DNA-directed RNA polymerase subunit RPC12/RpoP